MSMSRLELFGMFRRAPQPRPEPAPEPFSLDRFYRDRAPARPLPSFVVRGAELQATTRVGAGPAAPRVVDDACLAARSFCSVCVERCPRRAIVVERGRPRVVPAACDGCGECVAVCPAPVLALVFDTGALPAPEPRDV